MEPPIPLAKDAKKLIFGLLPLRESHGRITVPSGLFVKQGGAGGIANVYGSGLQGRGVHVSNSISPPLISSAFMAWKLMPFRLRRVGSQP